MQGIFADRIDADEIWSFCYAKQEERSLRSCGRVQIQGCVDVHLRRLGHQAHPHELFAGAPFQAALEVMRRASETNAPDGEY